MPNLLGMTTHLQAIFQRFWCSPGYHGFDQHGLVQKVWDTCKSHGPMGLKLDVPSFFGHAPYGTNLRGFGMA